MTAKASRTGSWAVIPSASESVNSSVVSSVNDLIVINAPLVPANWRPLAGDWNGNGTDAVGLYNPQYVQGNYALLPGNAYGPKEPVWEYTAQPRSNFFATIISGVQRLPNGKKQTVIM